MKRSSTFRLWRLVAIAPGITVIVVGLWNLRGVPDNSTLPEAAVGEGLAMETPDPDLDGSSSRSLERASAPTPEPPRATTEVPAPAPELEPWRDLRLAEIDRQLGVLVQGGDPMMRQTDLQYLFAICISPIADEMGLSEPTIADNVTRRVVRNAHEHFYTFGNREYRIPEGLFPSFDEYQRVWAERDRRLSALSPAEAARGLPDPWPLDPSYLAELRALADRAKAAVRLRAEAY